MNNDELSIKIREIIDKLSKSEIASHIDDFPPPPPFRGEGKIKLIILGQDPTVHDPEDRKTLKVTLHLDQPGGLRRYVEEICEGLDLDLDKNIYATNLLKNFFDKPPDTMREENPQFFQKAAGYWIPLLKEEIEEFENVPILTLGEPVLNSLTNSPDRVFIKNCWGFEKKGQYGRNFGYIKPTENLLSRVIFPFPHLPGRSRPIYRQQMNGYLAFIKKQFFHPAAKL
jgi:uracil-DNA glycosylase